MIGCLGGFGEDGQELVVLHVCEESVFVELVVSGHLVLEGLHFLQLFM